MEITPRPSNERGAAMTDKKKPTLNLNQGEEPVTRKRGSEAITKEKAGEMRKEKARGPVTVYGKPYDLSKWGRGS